MPKKERKVSFDNRPVFIKPIHRETSIQNGNSQIGKTSDETQRLGCLHRLNRCIPTRADTSSIQEVSSLRTRRSSLSLFGPTVRNVPKSVNFFETDGRYCSFSTPTCHISFSIPRRLADKKSDSQPTDYSENFCIQTIQSLGFLPNLKKLDLFPAQKFTFIGMEFLTQQNLVRVPADHVQNLILTIKKIMSAKHDIGTNFPFPFRQTHCCSRPCSHRQTALTSSSDVLAVCLETSYSSSRSPDLDKRYDSISLTMVDKPHLIQDRDFYPSSRPRILPL